MKTISPTELQNLLAAQPGLTVLDVRTPVEFAEIHVPQARNEPLDQLNPQALIDAGLPVNRGATKVISLERQVRIAAGSLVLTGILLAWLVHPYFIALPAFVGAGLVFAGITDWCGMGLLLARLPWNSRKPG